MRTRGYLQPFEAATRPTSASARETLGRVGGRGRRGRLLPRAPSSRLGSGRRGAHGPTALDLAVADDGRWATGDGDEKGVRSGWIREVEGSTVAGRDRTPSSLLGSPTRRLERRERGRITRSASDLVPGVSIHASRGSRLQIWRGEDHGGTRADGMSWSRGGCRSGAVSARGRDDGRDRRVISTNAATRGREGVLIWCWKWGFVTGSCRICHRDSRIRRSDAEDVGCCFFWLELADGVDDDSQAERASPASVTTERKMPYVVVGVGKVDRD